MREGQLMVVSQPGIFMEVSNDVDAIEEYIAVSSAYWALTYIQNWNLASTFFVITIIAVVMSL
jgi:hypothetical protein